MIDIQKLREQRFSRFKDSNVKKTEKPLDKPLDDKVQITYDEEEKSFNIYITDVITGPEDYTNVFDTFLLAHEDETIRVLLATPGGRLDTVNKIRGLSSMTKARTIAIVGDVASAGTILALSFDEMIVLPNIEFMVHNYSGGVFGKGHELYTHAKFLQNEMPKIFTDFYKDFLTPEEIEEVLSGQDLYLNAEQVAERWDRVVEVKEELYQNAHKEQVETQISNTINYLKENGYTVTKPTEPVKKTKVKPK